jgi:hypothetical protein
MLARILLTNRNRDAQKIRPFEGKLKLRFQRAFGCY